MIEPISNVSMIAEMNAMRLQSSQSTPSSSVEVTSVFKDALNAVNGAQSKSKNTTQKFMMGDPSVSLSDVTMDSYKSDIAMSSMREVRNKMLSNLKDLMNTQL